MGQIQGILCLYNVSVGYSWAYSDVLGLASSMQGTTSGDYCNERVVMTIVLGGKVYGAGLVETSVSL